MGIIWVFVLGGGFVGVVRLVFYVCFFCVGCRSWVCFGCWGECPDVWSFLGFSFCWCGLVGLGNWMG